MNKVTTIKDIRSTMDLWIRKGLVPLQVLGIVLAVLLQVEHSAACSCEFKHPQHQLCEADFVIKATVKRTDVVTEDVPDVINNLTQDTYDVMGNELPLDPIGNESHPTEPVKPEPMIRFRVFYVKVKKVFKYTEEYGAVEARYKDQEMDLMPIYTAPYESLCGVVNLELKTTYLLQGQVIENELHIHACKQQLEWTQQNVPVYTRKAYSGLYENNCHCNVRIESQWLRKKQRAEPNECIWDRRKDIDGCYGKHSVCMKKENSDRCKWTKPASLRACLQKTEQRRNMEP